MLDWLVIGGGLHGTYLSLWLTTVGGVPRDRVRVLDPRGHPFERWHHCTRNCGVDVLRSPFVHHLDPDAGSLARFAARRHPGRTDFWTGPYRRPSIEIFEEHANWVYESHALASLRCRGKALGLTPVPHGLRVETDRGGIEAREVVIAVGHTDRLELPSWARRMQSERVVHVFDDAYRIQDVAPGERVAVVGGGLSAAQAVLALARRTSTPPTLVTRHQRRIGAFDQDPCWLGPKCLAQFQGETCLVERRQHIAAARARGSLPQDIAARFSLVVGRGRARERMTEVAGAAVRGEQVELLYRDGARETFDRVVLATGFELRRPGGAWLDEAVASLGLPLAPCGFPKLGPGLQWAPHLRAVGGLAELAVGPAARNLAGVRMAAELLAA